MKILLFGQSHGDADDTNSNAGLLRSSLSSSCNCEKYFSPLFLAERPWPVSTRAGCFLQSNTWKLLCPPYIPLAPINFCTCKAAHSRYWAFVNTSRSHFIRKPFFMPLYMDAFGLSHKPLSCLLGSPGLVMNTSQVQTLIKLEVHSSQA